MKLARRFNAGTNRIAQVPEGTAGVSVSQLDTRIQYIKSQEDHHRGMTFQEEFLALLKKHRIDYDARNLWG